MTGFLRRNAIHIVMAVLFAFIAIVGLALWDREGLAVWLSRSVGYCA